MKTKIVTVALALTVIFCGCHTGSSVKAGSDSVSNNNGAPSSTDTGKTTAGDVTSEDNSSSGGTRIGTDTAKMTTKKDSTKR